MNWLVCSKENASVDRIKMTAAHASAGHHERNHAPVVSLGGTRWTSSLFGAGCGFRQGSVVDIQCFVSFSIVTKNEGIADWRRGHNPALFHAVIGRFFGDYHIMNVAFAQPRSSDANKAGFLGEFRKRTCADIAHAAS